jgi:hypothetical protein
MSGATAGRNFEVPTYEKRIARKSISSKGATDFFV